MSMFPVNQRNVECSPNDKEKIEASVASESSKIYASQKLAPFFQVEVTLRIFGHEIWHWVFPPEKKSV